MTDMLYKGFVAHARHLPVSHRFSYPVYAYGIDVDKLPVLDRRLPFFGYNRVRPASIHDTDYLDGRPGRLKDKVLAYLPTEKRGEVAAVTLITSARYFNYVFNPVSFFYCQNGAGNTVAMVVEVNNTFGERHVYVPEKAEDFQNNHWMHFRAEKAFHVSPFNDLAGRYEFFFSPPGNELDIKIHLVKDGEKAFEARLWGKGRALTPASQIRMLLRHPFMPHLTKPRIFFEAARLYFRKRLKYHPKPEPISPMTMTTKRKRKKH
ncbi:MAG: DUF1365 domain-containing protein [Thermodesulfobacteriota bacterium]